MALNTIFVAGARRIGMHMVSVLLSEMVRPYHHNNREKTIIAIGPNKLQHGAVQYYYYYYYYYCSTVCMYV